MVWFTSSVSRTSFISTPFFFLPYFVARRTPPPLASLTQPRGRRFFLFFFFNIYSHQGVEPETFHFLRHYQIHVVSRRMRGGFSPQISHVCGFLRLPAPLTSICLTGDYIHTVKRSKVPDMTSLLAFLFPLSLTAAVAAFDSQTGNHSLK